MKSSDQIDLEFEGPQKLKPLVSRLATLIFIAIFAGTWNCITWLTIVQPWGRGFQAFDVIFFMFSIPFVLVGVVLLVALIYFSLGMFNPTVEIALSNGAVVLGDEIDLAWQVANGFRSIRRLQISIQARESATYQKGTDTTTDEQIVAEIPVVDSQSPEQIAFGTATIRIPADSMHSFDGKNNKIRWTISVIGDIPYWPNVTEQFAFRVKPFLYFDNT